MRLSLYTLGYPVRDIVDRAFDFYFFRKNVKSIYFDGWRKLQISSSRIKVNSEVPS
jgi:hypothetical protein